MSKAVDQITREDAQILTDQIRVAVDQLWELLLEAHERKAWKALGYGTWDAYIAGEFSMSRRRSYQLLDQGMVNRAIADAKGDVNHGSHISERKARDIKPVIDDVAAEIQSRVESGEDPEAAVKSAVDAAREAKAQEKVDRAAEKQRKAEQLAEFDRQREANREGLSDSVKEHEARKAEAKAVNKAKTAASIDALEAEVDELREANASLEQELAEVKADNAKWQDMRVQFEQGGFEKVIADKDEEIRALLTRVETESADKVSYKHSALFWKEQAHKLGYGEDDVIPLKPRGGANG